MNSQLNATEQKKLSVLLSNTTHKSLKLKALSEDKSITEIVTVLIEKYILHSEFANHQGQHQRI